MNPTGTNISPIVKVATVSAAAPEAFRIFTERFGRWWPLATHSVGRSRSAGVSFGRAVGDPIIEMLEDGSRTQWGTILTWLPPDRVVFTWHPGGPEEEATIVEVTFVPQPEGGTRVTLTHRGWQAQPDAAEARAEYDPGWDAVLGSYLTMASSSA